MPRVLLTPAQWAIDKYGENQIDIKAEEEIPGHCCGRW